MEKEKEKEEDKFTLKVLKEENDVHRYLIWEQSMYHLRYFITLTNCMIMGQVHYRE